MKNIAGTLCGFIVGSAGFMVLFKVLILDHTSPEDELGPGIVVLTALMIGVACAVVGHWIQDSIKRKPPTEPKFR